VLVAFFQVIAVGWDALDLPALKLTLDDQAHAIAEAVELRQGARKGLGALAKAAKSVGAETGSVPSAQVVELVEAFKGEIDATTKRAKAAEGFFLALYRRFRDDELRDPALVLHRCAELGRASLASLTHKAGITQAQEARAEALVGRLSELGLASSSQHLEGSGAVAALEGLLADERASIEAEAKVAAAAQWETERLKNDSAAQEAVAAAVAEGDRRVALVEAQLTMAIAEAEAGAAAVAERTTLEATLERTRDDMKAIEKKLAQSTLDLGVVKTQATVAEAAADSAADTAAAAERARAEAERKVEVLEAEKASLQSKVEAHASTLASRPSEEVVAALRSRIRMLERLQTIEVDGEDGDKEEEDEGEESGSRSSRQDEVSGSPAEVEKDSDALEWVVRHTETLKLALKHEKRQRALAEQATRDAEASAAVARTAAAEAKDEAARLEMDLVTANQVVDTGKIMLKAFQARPEYAIGGSQGRRGGVSSTGGLFGLSLFSSQRRAPAAASEVLSLDASSSVGEVDVEAESAPLAAGHGAADRLLNAVQGQRDRFRKEAARRETELVLAKKMSEQQAAEVATLRRDNASLYKKVRYLSGTGGGSLPVGRPDESLDDVEAKYARQYETALDPFSAWDNRERLGAASRLSCPERVLLRIFDWLLPHRPRRAMLLVYLIALHAVVLFHPMRPAVMSESIVDAFPTEEPLPER
jgi:homeobox protein cut-like